MPKKETADKKFQIQNNLAPAECLVIDRNRFRHRSTRAKKFIQTASKAIGKGDKRKRICQRACNKYLVFVLLVRLMTCFPVLTQRAKHPASDRKDS